jgi:hypothetical protein
MKEYLKNKNEYFEDGKLYIEAIKKCECSEKRYSTYFIDCSIHQRGVRTYTYKKGAEFIEKDDCSGKKLWLCQKAMQAVKEAVSAFDEAVEQAKTGDYEKIEIKDIDYVVYIEKPIADKGRIVKESDCGGITEISTGGIFGAMSGFYYRGKSDRKSNRMFEICSRPNEETIKENPFYLAALRTGDELLALEIKLHYNVAAAQDCRRLTELTGKRVLPKLPEKYNRRYAVTKDSVSYELLGNSGYGLGHWPCFAMMNRTYKNITLNPHTRTGGDSAPADEEPITFDEFLKLFEEAENNE